MTLLYSLVRLRREVQYKFGAQRGCATCSLILDDGSETFGRPTVINCRSSDLDPVDSEEATWGYFRQTAFVTRSGDSS